MAVQKATVVKNPKEFWSLTSVECIFDSSVREEGIDDVASKRSHFAPTVENT